MNLKEKSALVARANERRGAISDAKGPEYAGQAEAYGTDGVDVLANFKRQAERWGVSPLVVAGIYEGKHQDALETFVRELQKAAGDWAKQFALVRQGEGILSRLDDLRNYADLFEGLLADLNLHPATVNPEVAAMQEALAEVQTEDYWRRTSYINENAAAAKDTYGDLAVTDCYLCQTVRYHEGGKHMTVAEYALAHVGATREEKHDEFAEKQVPVPQDPPSEIVVDAEACSMTCYERGITCWSDDCSDDYCKVAKREGN